MTEERYIAEWNYDVAGSLAEGEDSDTDAY